MLAKGYQRILYIAWFKIKISENNFLKMSIGEEMTVKICNESSSRKYYIYFLPVCDTDLNT